MISLVRGSGGQGGQLGQLGLVRLAIITNSPCLFAGTYTFCFIADYTIDFFGYDLCIIAIIFTLEPEKFFLTSWIHVVIFVTIDFFWRL